MTSAALLVHPADNVWVALRDLPADHPLPDGGCTREPVAAKHKIACRDLCAGEVVIMYGVEVGRARQPVARGEWVARHNIAHSAAALRPRSPNAAWNAPDVSAWRERHFEGYWRGDGNVGTANLWLVVPMVFCENHKLQQLREALQGALGYAVNSHLKERTERMVAALRDGAPREALLSDMPMEGERALSVSRLFPNVDGVRFLSHHMGCGGTPDDTRALCRLLAASIAHPNVAGATVLSLGCQHAQVSLLQTALQSIPGAKDKPVFICETQADGGEVAVLDKALRLTLYGCSLANEITRRPAPLSKLAIGVKCGASDGFSGISANPALGRVSDLVVALGGRVVLGEFPELCGVEQELIDRSIDSEVADRFVELMRRYDARLAKEGAGFDMNPSPGNVRDGLITDAMKSAGAARKGGTSPVVDALDYPETLRRDGLSLLCTPGHDVESVTAIASSGANLVLFTTGLGTAVGNAIAPVIKVSSNSELPLRQPGIIDVDAGAVIGGAVSLDAMGAELLEACIDVASGRRSTCADRLGQHDFMPWKRGMSL